MISQIRETIRKIFQIEESDENEHLNPRYECIFITHGIIRRDLDSGKYKVFDFSEETKKRLK